LKRSLQIHPQMSSHEPLKVLMLTSCYPRNHDDSAGLFVRQMAETLSKLAMEIHVLAPSDGKKGTFIENNVVVHRFEYFPSALQGLAYGSGMLSNLRRRPWLWVQVPPFLLCMAYAAFRIIRKENPHLIHAHWILPQGFVAVLAKFVFRKPVITTAHGSDAFALRGWLTEPLKRFVLRQSNAWTSNTRATAGALGAPGRLPTPHVIPMGVNVGEFQKGMRSVRRKELPDGELLVLFVGRLVESKGLADLLTAMSLLPPDLRSRTTLWIIGEGAGRTELQALCDALGIGAKTRFLGHLSNHILPDFYAAGDLLVVPSISTSWGEAEGQGIVTLEAFANRLCVLATSTGGTSEVIDDGQTGILVEPRSPEKLAAAMTRLLNSQELRRKLGSNGWTKVNRCYDWKKIADDFSELYQAVL